MLEDTSHNQVIMSSSESKCAMEVHKLTEYPAGAWEKEFQHKCLVNEVKPLPLDTPRSQDMIRFVCVSDTHNQHKHIEIPPGDVLLHAGDFTLKGLPWEVEQFNDFIGQLPHPHKIVIAGNHEPTFDPICIREKRKVAASLTELSSYGVDNIRELLTNCTYLEDSGIELFGIKIFGSPWQPEWYGFGFNLPRGQQLLDKWNLIPTDTDILITHGPPLGYGDIVRMGVDGNRAGCVDLLQTVRERIKPKYHIFGHIHSGYGIRTDGTTTFINASCVDEDYVAAHPPIIFDVPRPASKSKCMQHQNHTIHLNRKLETEYTKCKQQENSYMPSGAENCQDGQSQRVATDINGHDEAICDSERLRRCMAGREAEKQTSDDSVISEMLSKACVLNSKE